MFRALKITLFLAVLFFSCEKPSHDGGTQPGGNQGGGNPSIDESGDVRIIWETPQKVTSGGYPRVHRLNDGRLMLTCADAFDGYAMFSSNNGASWGKVRKCPMQQFTTTTSAGKALVSVAVPDFAQLSSKHPHHPNRIIFAGNYRPRTSDGKTTGKTTVYPNNGNIERSVFNIWQKILHITKKKSKKK